MRIQEPATIDERTISSICDQLSDKHEITLSTGDRTNLETLSRLCIAATGGHLIVPDVFFNQCMSEVRPLSQRKLQRWKTKVDDAAGVRRRVFYCSARRMLCAKDDVGTEAPLVPKSVSMQVNGNVDLGQDMVSLGEHGPWIPRFMMQRVCEAVVTSRPRPPPLPVVEGSRRARLQ
jgi:hypothetical protein